MLKQYISLAAMLIISISIGHYSVLAEESGEFEYELDPYYSNIAWVKGFDDREIPVIPNLNELNIYQLLSEDILVPRFWVLEASLNPMPILGVYAQKNHPSIYKKDTINANILSALTTGFDEPLAVSVFAGNIVRFAPPEGMETEGDDKGYVGLLLSLGNQHIITRRIVDDNWAEIEWKIKGKRKTAAQYLSWSYRVGAKIHSHSDIADTLMLGLRRDRIDFTQSKDNFFHDIGFEYRLDLLQHNLRASRQQLVIDKHWPLKQKEVSFSIGFGFIWKGSRMYSGSLAQEQEKWALILRPNIRF